MTVLRQEYDTLRRNHAAHPGCPPVYRSATADETNITAKRRGWGYVRRPVGVPATVYEPAVTVRKKRKSRSKTNSKTRSNGAESPRRPHTFFGQSVMGGRTKL